MVALGGSKETLIERFVTEFGFRTDTAGLSSFERRVTGLQGKLKGVGAAAINWSMPIAVDNRIINGLESIGGAAMRTGRKAGLLATAFTTAFARIDDVQSVTAAQTGQSVEAIKEYWPALSEIGERYGIFAESMLTAQRKLLSAGYVGDDVIDLAERAAAASLVGFGDPGALSSDAASALKIYEELGPRRYFDMLQEAARLGTMDPGTLGGPLSTVLATAGELGIELHQILGMISAMSVLNVKPDRAATGIRQIMGAFLDPGEEQKKALEELQADVPAGQRETMKSIREAMDADFLAAIQSLVLLADNDVEALASIVGSKEAVNALLTIAGQNYAATRSTVDAINLGSEGALDTAVEERQGRVWTEARRLLVKMHNAISEFGARFEGFALRIIGWGHRIMDVWAAVPNWMKEGIALAIKLISSLVLVGAAFTGLALVLKVAGWFILHGLLLRMIGGFRGLWAILRVLGLAFGPLRMGLRLASGAAAGLVGAMTALGTAAASALGSLAGAGRAAKAAKAAPAAGKAGTAAAGAAAGTAAGAAASGTGAAIARGISRFLGPVGAVASILTPTELESGELPEGHRDAQGVWGEGYIRIAPKIVIAPEIDVDTEMMAAPLPDELTGWQRLRDWFSGWSGDVDTSISAPFVDPETEMMEAPIGDELTGWQRLRDWFSGIWAPDVSGSIGGAALAGFQTSDQARRGTEAGWRKVAGWLESTFRPDAAASIGGAALEGFEASDRARLDTQAGWGAVGAWLADVFRPSGEATYRSLFETASDSSAESADAAQGAWSEFLDWLASPVTGLFDWIGAEFDAAVSGLWSLVPEPIREWLEKDEGPAVAPPPATHPLFGDRSPGFEAAPVPVPIAPYPFPPPSPPQGPAKVDVFIDEMNISAQGLTREDVSVEVATALSSEIQAQIGKTFRAYDNRILS